MPLLPLLFLTVALSAHSQTAAPPELLSRIEPMAVQAQAFDAAAPGRPLVIRSAQEAGSYFAAPELTRLSLQVDFSRQQVLLFAWRGSGQDKLEAVLGDSAVTFIYSPGRTRDLREHHAVFVLGSDLTWSLR
ncbi:MAG: hypothetical protein WCK08_07185 [Betaproteobacteria bacterium]